MYAWLRIYLSAQAAGIVLALVYAILILLTILSVTHYPDAEFRYADI